MSWRRRASPVRWYCGFGTVCGDSIQAIRTIASLLLLSTAGSAAAQDFTVHPGWLIEPQPGTFYENGVGAPSVAYDAASDTYVMFFETRKYPVLEGCTGGGWVIGTSTSSDGLTWSEPTVALEPQAGSYFSCQAAHPLVVKDGNTWKVWFKAVQRGDACDSGTPSWGCNTQTGVGYMSNDGTGWTVSSEPVVNVSGFGFPAVTKVGNTWHMLLTKIPDIHHTTSTDGVNWGPLSVALKAGFTAWTEDRAFNPAVVCEDIATRHSMTLFIGGKDLQDGGTTILSGGWGMALSGDGDKWYVGAEPKFSWFGDLSWRHWDAIRVGDDDYLVYFSEKNSSNQNRVGIAYTTPSWNESLISDRICP